MKRSMIWILAVAVLLSITSSHAGVPPLMNYQGKLTDSLGVPVPDGAYTIWFRIYTDSVGGDVLWAEEQWSVPVNGGLFNALLGSTEDIPDTVFTGPTRWLGVQISPDPELSPRKPIITMAYAFHSATTDTASYALKAPRDDDWLPDTSGFHIYRPAGNVGIGMVSLESKLGVAGTAEVVGLKMSTGASDGYVLTSDADGVGSWQAAPVGGNWTVTDSVLYTANYWGIARGGSDNAVLGDSAHTHVNLGVACSVGTSGENQRYCTVSGGWQNDAYDVGATVGGGWQNSATAGSATVSGGNSNTSEAGNATVSGGALNVAGGYCSTVGGGGNNMSGEEYATVGGGYHNASSGYYATVGGGENNSASGQSATVGGGVRNNASNWFATVCGGRDNTANSGATVGGGAFNAAEGQYCVVGGGHSDTVITDFGTVAGGRNNTATGMGYATIGGGYQNRSGGWGATVPGGYANTANGYCSFAAGDSVQISGHYTFAFGRDFSTSTPNAVIFHNSVDPIRVGIGTTSPNRELDVNGTILGALPLVDVALTIDDVDVCWALMVAGAPTTGTVFVRSLEYSQDLDSPNQWGTWVDFGCPDENSKMMGISVSLVPNSFNLFYAIITARMSSGTVYLRSLELGDLDSPSQWGSWVDFGSPGL